MRLADIIEQYSEELAKAETTDSGKTYKTTLKTDIPIAQHTLRYFASSVFHIHASSVAMPSQAINYSVHHPVGIVGCISPGNLPLYLFIRNIAPALAVGIVWWLRLRN